MLGAAVVYTGLAAVAWLEARLLVGNGPVLEVVRGLAVVVVDDIGRALPASVAVAAAALKVPAVPVAERSVTDEVFLVRLFARFGSLAVA